MNNIEIGKLVCSVISEQTVKQKQLNNLKLISPDSWESILNYLLHYNLVPLFYFKLHKLDFENEVPKDILLKFKNVYNKQTSIHLKRNYEIKKIIAILNKEKIDVILLKGIYLANKYYDSPAQRPMCDTDILVKYTDLEKTVSSLRRFGCKQENNLEIKKCENFIQHLPPLFTPKNNCIEVHWKLTADLNDIFNVKYNLDEIWETKEKIKFENEECFIFKLEYLLIHLCVHISEEIFLQKILHLYDVYLTITKNTVNYKHLFEKAEEWNCVKAVYSVFFVIQELFLFNFPEAVKNKIDKLFTTEEKLKDNLISLTLKDLQTVPDKKNFAEKLKNKHITDKLKYLLWTTFNKERLIFWNGKSEFILILYIKRIIWLIIKYTNIYLFNRNNYKAIYDECDPNVIRKWFET